MKPTVPRRSSGKFCKKKNLQYREIMNKINSNKLSSVSKNTTSTNADACMMDHNYTVCHKSNWKEGRRIVELDVLSEGLRKCL